MGRKLFFDHKDKLKEIEKRIWVELYAAANGASTPAMKLPAVATVQVGQPQIRSVVLRKVEDKRLCFYTDSRTDKWSALSRNPILAMHFYDHERRLQVRIRGEAILHIGDELARDEFAKLEESQVREYNALPSPGTAIKDPSQPYETREPQDDRYFCVVELIAEQLTLLQLNEDHHYCAQFHYDGMEYTAQWVMP